MRIIRSASSWAKTCNLLSTKMPTRISSQHQKWVENESQINEVFKRLNFNREIDLIVHDGPPYANGAPHIGHAANKILKDFIVRRAVLNGKCVNFRPGWDCHGMPIEHKVLSTNKLSDPIQLRQMCQRESLAHAKRQSSEFQKWGLFADWDNPYYTLDPKIQASQLRLFWKLYEVGVVTCDVKPVFWSPSSKSTLAEAELEYNDNHVSTAAFVSFPITNGIECPRPNAFLMVWTTQPWTLAANKAVAYAPTASYTWLVSDHDPTAAFLVAIECVSLIQKHISGLKQLSHCIAGETLGNISYTLPLFGNTGASHLFPSAHVKLDSGSGLVHLAPCHGEDDFHIARRHNLSTQSILDDEGRMTNIPGNPVAGSQGDKAVLDLFTHNVLISYPYKHSYPYDWRTRKPIIRLVSRQWFVKPLVEECRTILRSTDFYPSNGESDLNSMLAGRPYWCISRQRAWGVPIPVFYKTLNSDEDILINKDVVYHVAAMVEEKGTSDFWWTESSENLLPKSISDAEDWKPGRDIFDVWFDSGSTWHTVLKQLPNCEYKPVIYLEGRDQLRGWFQSSLLLCSAAERRSPFSTLIMHGFVVDGNGRKMSKSEGNVISPDQVLKEWGVGVLRAWVASIDYHDNMVLSNLSNIAQICKRLRFVLRFMLGNLDKSILESRDSLLPSCFKVSYDKYILDQLFQLNQKCNVAFDKYRFSFVFKLISDFVTKDLSAFYFDGVKDRLYCSSKLDPQRLSAVYTMECVLQTLSFHLAPLLPHLVEEVHIYHPMRNSISYFDRKPFICPDWWPNEKLSSIIDKAINIRNAIHSQLNTTPHEIKKHCVHLTTNSDSLLAELLFLQECGTLLELMGTCEISCQKAIDVENYVVINNAKVGLEIKKSDKFLCGRCRNLWADVEGDLCSRCSHVIKTFF